MRKKKQSGHSQGGFVRQRKEPGFYSKLDRKLAEGLGHWSHMIWLFLKEPSGYCMEIGVWGRQEWKEEN